MSRRHAPARRWRVGDACQIPVEIRMGYSRVHHTRTYWERGEVVAVRGDRVVVRRWRFETVHPWWEIRVPPKPYAHCRFRRPGYANSPVR